jgi:hypothetical protein
MVVCAVGIELEGLLRSWYRYFCVRVLSRQIAHQTDFFVFGEFVARVQNACVNEGNEKGG